MSTLAQLEARVAARLGDPTNAVYTTASIDEALRSALAEYQTVAPLTAETVITLPGDGREIALSGVSGLLTVSEVWWPYDSSASSETWPPNQVKGFRLWFDDAQPLLFLNTINANQPQQSDELRLWYTKAQTIQNLDSAAVTTPPTTHETGLVTGAAAYAALANASAQIGSVRLDPDEVSELEKFALARMLEFRAWLVTIKAAAPTHGEPFGPGWQLDKWEELR